jgi:hypothetical protein
MNFFSEQLVSSDYCGSLRNDLQQADVCRFLIAYISDEGLKSIGRTDLIRVLRHDDSFGIGSLSCACGYEPLLNLQRDLRISDVRLKYFMDPMVKGSDEPEGIVLFHSKLVYLRLRHPLRRGDRNCPQQEDFHLHGAGDQRRRGVGGLIPGDGLHQG